MEVMNDALEKHLDRMISGAERYAAGDKSDPFTFARALAHIKQGLCGACEAPEMVWYGDKVGGSQGEDGHYDAKSAPEKCATADGSEYLATVYHNMVRP